jgi:hypothetical protein
VAVAVAVAVEVAVAAAAVVVAGAGGGAAAGAGAGHADRGGRLAQGQVHTVTATGAAVAAVITAAEVTRTGFMLLRANTCEG